MLKQLEKLFLNNNHNNHNLDQLLLQLLLIMLLQEFEPNRK